MRPLSPALRPVLGGAAVMTAYAAVHSLLATDTAKELAARIVGQRARDVGYRPFYLAQSVAATVALVKAVERLSEQTLVVYPPPVARGLQGVHAAAYAFGVWALVAAGVGRISGLDNAARAVAGARVKATPPAHGPYEGGPGRLGARGPFARSRHPLNVAFLLLLWPTRRLTSRRLGAALTGTAYVFAGSLLEERRNAAAYGSAYERYRWRVPFFWPRLSA